MAFLEIDSLRKRFGSLEILKGINLSLEKGLSRAGRSVRLRQVDLALPSTIAGLETVSSGEIRIDGDVINDLHPSKRDIAMVFQSYALYPNMSVVDMAFGMEMRYGVPKPERDKAVARSRQDAADRAPRTAGRASFPAAKGMRRDGSRLGAPAARVSIR